jgi:cob(I)alamin adenosyltransferase
MERGYVQVYTGDGKGKTTAALGVAVRAAGHGFRTYVGQFMKGQSYGEIEALRDHPLITIEQYGSPRCLRREGEIEALRDHPLITIEQYGGPRCFRREDVTVDDVARARQGMERALDAMASGRYEIVVLDEVNVALWFGLVSTQAVLAFLDRRPSHVELILTGRRAAAEVIERADLVTEMTQVKHYYHEGVPARDGIER